MKHCKGKHFSKNNFLIIQALYCKRKVKENIAWSQLRIYEQLNTHTLFIYQKLKWDILQPLSPN